MCEIDFGERKLRDRVNALEKYCVENMKDTQTGFSRDAANFIKFCLFGERMIIEDCLGGNLFSGKFFIKGYKDTYD